LSNQFVTKRIESIRKLLQLRNLLKYSYYLLNKSKRIDLCHLYRSRRLQKTNRINRCDFDSCSNGILANHHRHRHHHHKATKDCCDDLVMNFVRNHHCNIRVEPKNSDNEDGDGDENEDDDDDDDDEMENDGDGEKMDCYKNDRWCLTNREHNLLDSIHHSSYSKRFRFHCRDFDRITRQIHCRIECRHLFERTNVRMISKTNSSSLNYDSDRKRNEYDGHDDVDVDDYDYDVVFDDDHCDRKHPKLFSLEMNQSQKLSHQQLSVWPRRKRK
ncbi:hypothetical protein SSS_10400, partial [Sarcoptes scabiei]